MTEITRYDSADYLDSPGAVAAYLEAAFEEGEPDLIAHALGVVARARGMSQIARDAGLSEENVSRALSPDRNPELSSLIRVLSALGLRLAAAPTGPKDSSPTR